MAGRFGYARDYNYNNSPQGERKELSRISLPRDQFPELYPSAARKLEQMHANLDRMERQAALRQASENDRKAAEKAKAEEKKALNNLHKKQQETFGFTNTSKPRAFRKETMLGKIFRKFRGKQSPKAMRRTGKIMQKAKKASNKEDKRRMRRRQASLTRATGRGLNPQTVGAMGAVIAEHRKRTGQPLPTSALINTVVPPSKINTVAKMNNVSMNLERSLPKVPTHKPELSPRVTNSVGEKVAVAVGGRRRKTRKHHKKKTKRRKAKRKHRRTNKKKRRSNKKRR